ncbi:O-antigen ligase family protein [Agaribacter marinus]|uniref:Polymerase n=1 Tax=Agaribacter marinus TaxID=1431249 RepID=A0AA37WLQ3_9ALTE|nr:O-antigen ligase family protein [Agaribacter marinus]GLR72874.1 polymerase [Agaribacter marinus]
MQLAIFGVSTYVAWALRKDKLLGVSKYISMLTIWIAFIIYSVFQILPLPSFLLELLSPHSAAMYDLTNAASRYISTDLGQSKINLIKLLSYFCLLMLTLQLVNTESRVKLLLTTMVASGTFQAVYGSLEILLNASSSLVFGLEVNDIATGSFVYKNHYANFLMLCLCAGMGLLVTSIEKEKNVSPKDMLRAFASTMLSSKALVRIALAVMVIALVMSRSRMGNTAFFSSMAITGILALTLIRNRSNGLLILVASIFIIDLLIVSAYFGLERVKDRIVQTSIEQESRDEVVKEASKIIEDYPVFGTGGGSFYSIFPSYQESNISGFYDHAHNDYLQFVIEYGLLGTILLSAIVLFSLYKGLRAMKKRKNSIFKGVGFACSMAIFGMMLHATVDFPFQAYANACYFVLFIALSMISSSLKIRTRNFTAQNI